MVTDGGAEGEGEGEGEGGIHRVTRRRREEWT